MGKRELVALAAEPVMASRFRTRKLLEPESDVDCKCDDSLPSYPSACPMNVQLTCCCVCCSSGAGESPQNSQGEPTFKDPKKNTPVFSRVKPLDSQTSKSAFKSAACSTGASYGNAKEFDLQPRSLVECLELDEKEDTMQLSLSLDRWLEGYALNATSAILELLNSLASCLNSAHLSTPWPPSE